MIERVRAVILGGRDMSAERYAQIVRECGGWSVFIPGWPVAADGRTFDEAIEEMIQALREYAQDWQDRLSDAPNHLGNRGLVQLVGLSDDDQLREWLTAPSRYWTDGT